MANPYRIDDDGIDVSLAAYTEIRIAITRLKKNQASGADRLPAELWQSACISFLAVTIESRNLDR